MLERGIQNSEIVEIVEKLLKCLEFADMENSTYPTIFLLHILHFTNSGNKGECMQDVWSKPRGKPEPLHTLLQFHKLDITPKGVVWRLFCVHGMQEL